ncbi:MAG: glycoside hydrolase family 5 protein, partial [Nanoarchaeota archaeon]
NVVKDYGNLEVNGTKIYSEDGKIIQLKGLSSHGLQWFPFTRRKTLRNAVKYFDIDVIRVAMYVEIFKEKDFWNGYLAQPKYMEAKADMMIQEAIDEGIYVVLSWHIHNDPMKFKDEAMDFFKRASKKWGSYPNVMFEICNEPEGDIKWSKIKDYAIGEPNNFEDGVIDVIRKYDSDENENIILVGTPFWSQQVDKALEDPIVEYENIVYTLHFYASDHKEDIRQQAQNALDGGLPIFITEWGTCNYMVNGPIDFESSMKWIDWADKNNISWINWALANKNEKASILKPTCSIDGPWDEEDLTESGKFVKNLLKN